MEEKTADIDILEEKEKKAIEYLKLVAKERTLIPLCDDIKILLNLFETLIAENKELKEENEIWKSIYDMGNYRPFRKKYIELLDERNNTDEH